MANSDIVTIMKQKVISEIVNDPEIVKAFGSPNYDETDEGISGEDVFNNYIFTWNQNPNTITDVITFVTLQVNTVKYDSTKIKPTLIIYIYSHNNHMKLDSKKYKGISGNRNDYLSRLLDKKFNGRSSLGLTEKSALRLIGELTLVSNIEDAFNKDFVLRRLIFETKDMNTSLCNWG